MLCAMILAVQSITDTLIVSLQVPSTYEKETIVTLSESIEKAFLDDSLVSLLADDLNKSVKDEVTAANFETIIKLATSYKKIGSAEGT